MFVPGRRVEQVQGILLKREWHLVSRRGGAVEAGALA